MESKGPDDLANALDDVNPHILHMFEGPYNIYRKGTNTYMMELLLLILSTFDSYRCLNWSALDNMAEIFLINLQNSF